MDDEQALRGAASGEVYRTTMFADARAGGGYNYVITLPRDGARRVGFWHRAGVSTIDSGDVPVVMIDPEGDDVKVSVVADAEQYRLSAGSVIEKFGAKERVQDGESVDVLWVADDDRLYGAVPPEGWFLGAIGADR